MRKYYYIIIIIIPSGKQFQEAFVQDMSQVYLN